MILGHKIRLNPTLEQVEFFEKSCRGYRFAWNWALGKVYDDLNFYNNFNLSEIEKEFTRTKRLNFPFIMEVSATTIQRSFINLKQAFQNHKKNAQHFGKPNFKSRKREITSFYLTNHVLKINGNMVQIPKIGWVKMFQNLRFKGKIQSATISKIAGKWFIAFNVDVENFQKLRTASSKIAIDLGVSESVVSFDGTNFELFQGPKASKINQKKLARIQRTLARKLKQSQNYNKTRLQKQKLEFYTTNQRKDATHKYTTKLCRENQTIIIENLDVAEMMKTSNFSKYIADENFGELRRQLDYKSQIYNCNLIIANQYFPSSQLCSNCQTKNPNLTLKDRIWICKNCNSKHNRNKNAAKNLFNYQVRQDMPEFTLVRYALRAGQEPPAKSGIPVL